MSSKTIYVGRKHITSMIYTLFFFFFKLCSILQVISYAMRLGLFRLDMFGALICSTFIALSIYTHVLLPVNSV